MKTQKRFSANDREFHKKFIHLAINRFNKKFNSDVSNVKELIERYQKLNKFEQTLVFSDKVKDKLIHTMDIQLGKKSY